MTQKRTKDLFYNPIAIVNVLKEGENPPFSIRHRTVKAGTLLDHYDPHEGRIFKARYMDDFPIAVLLEGKRVWMSTTPFEVEGLCNAVKMSHGKVLVGGLGLGVFPWMISPKKMVKRIHIVEKEEKVIDLIYPQVRTYKSTVIHDDLCHYLSTTKVKYDFIYLDIWPYIIGPIQEVEKFKSLGEKCLKPHGKIMVWLQELIDRVKDKLPKVPQIGGAFELNHEPCLICSKTTRYDYSGLCMDCADLMGISDLFLGGISQPKQIST